MADFTPTSSFLERKHLFIMGQVQGVNYRYSMQLQAKELGVKGWCRNLPDGSVEAVLQGTPQQLEQMLTWCHQGPIQAKVSDIAIQNIPNFKPDDLDTEFQIYR
jgi:acylphosphatase